MLSYQAPELGPVALSVVSVLISCLKDPAPSWVGWPLLPERGAMSSAHVGQSACKEVSTVRPRYFSRSNRKVRVGFKGKVGYRISCSWFLKFL